MDRNVLNDIVNILCANIEKVHGVIITNGGVITNAYGMNKYEYLPEPEEGTIYIVSAMVLAANNSKPRCRGDLVAPATGHPECKRENGFIVSVPGFVRSSLNNSNK